MGKKGNTCQPACRGVLVRHTGPIAEEEQKSVQFSEGSNVQLALDLPSRLIRLLKAMKAENANFVGLFLAIVSLAKYSPN